MPDYADAISGAHQQASGWLGDGEGQATDGLAEQQAQELLDALQALGAPCPFVYPTEDGGFSFEWDVSSKSIGMKVIPLPEPDPDGAPVGFLAIVYDRSTQ